VMNDQRKRPLPDNRKVNLFGYYCANRVTTPDHYPEGPHWQAVLFTQRAEYEPPYDRNDTGGTRYFDETEVYVFTDEADLKQFCLFAEEERLRTASSKTIRGFRVMRIEKVAKPKFAAVVEL
jgi:hypothetical protein